MASQGAVRKANETATAWFTAGHLVLTVPTPAALTQLVAEAEDGQTVFCLSDSTMRVFNSTTGQHEIVSGDDIPPALVFDLTRDYVAGELAWDRRSLYRAGIAVTASATPPSQSTDWNIVGDAEPPAQDFSFTRDYVEGEFAWEATFLYRAMRGVPASLTYPSQDPANWEPVGVDNPVALPFDPTTFYEQGNLAWDPNHDELFVAITDVGQTSTVPWQDRTNWRPVGIVPYIRPAEPDSPVGCRRVPRLESP